MMTAKTPEQTRERLIDAALHTLQAHGASALTLSLVAKQAGVSKGGLLHHFPTKEALIGALLSDLFADFEVKVQRYLEQELPKPGRTLRAYIRATFDEQPLPMEVLTLLMSAIAEHESLLRMVQGDLTVWHERLMNDGIPPARATIIRQAVDAYWTERALHLDDAGEPALRQQIVDELIRMTREAAE
jgi:AcrR family transcriptional regulator